MGDVIASPTVPVTWVGMDVHMSSIAAAATITTTGELVQAKLTGDLGQAVQWARSLPGLVRLTYEAGPAGFGLARALREAGIDVVVCAPGLVPRAPRNRIKTDKRDAELLMRCLMAGQLSEVRVPTIAAARLRCFRGIQRLTAAGLVAEIGDFSRFSRPAAHELGRTRAFRAFQR